MDDATGEQVRDVLTKGGSGLGFILTTDDCRAAYEELKRKGVEFNEEPTERDYGIDCGFRDPSGNHIRLTQPA
jgi:predicted enzyme related to lactoylglutathione lyase